MITPGRARKRGPAILRTLLLARGSVDGSAVLAGEPQVHARFRQGPTHDLKLGKARGRIALWIGLGTEDYFSNLVAR
jgi:hypothetical protein